MAKRDGAWGRALRTVWLAGLPKNPGVKVVLTGICTGGDSVAVAIVQIGSKHIGHMYAFWFEPSAWTALLAGSNRTDVLLLDETGIKRWLKLDNTGGFEDEAYKLREAPDAGNSDRLIDFLEEIYPTPVRLLRYLRNRKG